jgi:hypothetical protein
MRAAGRYTRPLVKTFILSLAALSLVLACTPDVRVAARPECPARWHAEWTLDSALSLCVPPGFEQPRDSFPIFVRTHDYITRDYLRLYLEPRSMWDEDEPRRRWPPSLPARPCTVSDCAFTDSLTLHADTVAGVAGDVYVGLVTGGFAGVQRKPNLHAGWELPGERRLVIQAFSEVPATLDTIRMALRTIRVAPR